LHEALRKIYVAQRVMCRSTIQKRTRFLFPWKHFYFPLSL